MNIVVPIVMPVGGHIRGGGGGYSEVVDQLMESMPLFLGVPWLLYAITFVLGGSLVIATGLNEKIEKIVSRYLAWGAVSLSMYTLIYTLYWLVRYLIEQ